MNWPWVSRRHHETVAVLSSRMIADRDKRIAELEAERRMLWDKLCMFGMGATMFGVEAPAPEAPRTPDKKGEPAATSFSRRPTDIMRRQDTLAQQRFEQKQHPSRANRPVAALIQRADMKVGE